MLKLLGGNKCCVSGLTLSEQVQDEASDHCEITVFVISGLQKGEGIAKTIQFSGLLAGAL